MEEEKITEQSEPNINQPSTEDLCAQYLAGWKRAQADYVNLKKETDREKAEFSKYANERLLSSLLPAIDQFEMALAFTPDVSSLTDDMRKKMENWFVGIKAVRAGWETAFKDIGLDQVQTNGAFDPQIHEAVGEEEDTERSSGEIIRTTQSGWRLNGKLLRPAKVILAK